MKGMALLTDPVNGQITLRILSDLDLVDHRFKVNRTDDTSLQIPLLRRPTSLERELIEKAIGEFDIVEAEYEPHQITPESLETALSLLPPEVRSSVPKAFDIIGDIAIIELTPAMTNYQGLIAQALVRVHKNVKAVYSKAGPIQGTARVRPLQYLLGEHRTRTIHREFGCNFKVDLGKAFFSPRLSNEHKRVADLVHPDEHVVDMFAGVGPFSIMIARRHANVTVEAIDSNPEAIMLLEDNIRLNHVQGRVRTWNEDARVIVMMPELRHGATRVIMNHPSQAKLFVETASQAFQNDGGILHYYTFADGLEAEGFAVSELEEALEEIDWNIEETIFTRKVRATGPIGWQVVVDARIGPS